MSICCFTPKMTVCSFDFLILLPMAGVPGTEIKTIFDMNKAAKIQVKTTVGVADVFIEFEIVKHGTAGCPFAGKVLEKLGKGPFSENLLEKLEFNSVFTLSCWNYWKNIIFIPFLFFQCYVFMLF